MTNPVEIIFFDYHNKLKYFKMYSMIGNIMKLNDVPYMNVLDHISKFNDISCASRYIDYCNTNCHGNAVLTYDLFKVGNSYYFEINKNFANYIKSIFTKYNLLILSITYKDKTRHANVLYKENEYYYLLESNYGEHGLRIIPLGDEKGFTQFLNVTTSEYLSAYGKYCDGVCSENVLKKNYSLILKKILDFKQSNKNNKIFEIINNILFYYLNYHDTNKQNFQVFYDLNNMIINNINNYSLDLLFNITPFENLTEDQKNKMYIHFGNIDRTLDKIEDNTRDFYNTLSTL